MPNLLVYEINKHNNKSQTFISTVCEKTTTTKPEKTISLKNGCNFFQDILCLSGKREVVHSHVLSHPRGLEGTFLSIE